MTLRELFTVEYEGPTVTEDGVETLLAPGAKLRRVTIDYEAAARASVGDGYEVEDFHRKIARQIVDAALGIPLPPEADE